MKRTPGKSVIGYIVEQFLIGEGGGEAWFWSDHLLSIATVKTEEWEW